MITAAIICSERDFTPERLGTTLESIDGVVDRAVVVVSGDVSPWEGWIPVGVDLFHRPWTDHFSDARNYAIERCLTPWILTIDAGEQLAQGHGRMITGALERCPESVDGFMFDVLVPTSEKSEEATVGHGIRLFRNKPEYRYICRAHNQLTMDKNEAVVTNWVIVHPILPGDHEERMKRNKRMLDLLRGDMETDSDPEVLHYTMRAIAQIEDYMEKAGCEGSSAE